MPLIVLNKAVFNIVRNQVDPDGLTVRVMLTNGYTPNKKTHQFRSDVTNEISGAGYTAGGKTVTVTVTEDSVNDRVSINLGGTNWPAASITAGEAVYYVLRGGPSNADEVIAINDFDVGTVTSTNDTWTLDASTITIQN